ncbi:MAG: chorismate mutase [Bacteroidetes bacterium]|nr:chorismate mutase [Bacteroidota bacterium]
MMKPTNKNTPTFSIAQNADALELAHKISKETPGPFDIVLSGDNPDWLISSFINLKTHFQNMKVFYLSSNTNNKKLIDSLIKAGIDGIVFNESISEKEMEEIALKISKRDETVLPKNEEELIQSLRTQIDILDNKLMTLACERLEIVTQINKIKSKYNLPVFQPQRYHEIEKSVSNFATENHSDNKYLQKLINALHSASVIAQVNE